MNINELFNIPRENALSFTPQFLSRLRDFEKSKRKYFHSQYGYSKS